MPDMLDATIAIGLILLGAGLWLVSPALSLSVVGGFLVVIWFVAYLRAVKKKGG